MSVSTRIVELPPGARPAMSPGDAVAVGDELARARELRAPRRISLTRRLRCAPDEVAALCVVRPGQAVAAGEPLARAADGRVAPCPADALFAGCSRLDGTVLLWPFGEPWPVRADVRGRVSEITESRISIEADAARVDGMAGIGGPVHGPLLVAVHRPEDELRPADIDADAAGRIVVGGARASGEGLTRARAIGAAGVVVGGMLDRELRAFASVAQRRRALGGDGHDFAVLLLTAFGKAAVHPVLLDWLRRHDGNEATLLATEGTLYVYGAQPAPAVSAPPAAGDPVVALRRPHAGSGGRIEEELPALHAAGSGIVARSARVALDDGDGAIVPLANLEARRPGSGAP